MGERKTTVRKILAERHTRKPYVAAYIRVSSKKENQEESYEAQAVYYENLIRSNPEWDFAGVYGDRQSGTRSDNRAEFQRMIHDALAGKIDLIICKSASRWARNIVDGLDAVRHLTGNRVNIIFEQENIDTRQPGSVMLLNLSMAIAQTESESISENLKWLYRRRAEQGIFIAHKGKYFGFDTDDGNFRPNDDAKYISLIYDSFLAGESLTAIAEALNLLGIHNSWGNEWQRDTIRYILSNEVYVGDIRIQKKPFRNVITQMPDEVQISKYITDHHEGIIDRTTWDRVQRKLAEQTAKYSRYDDHMVPTDMDTMVLDMVQDGWSGTEIADRLEITIGQEKTCVRRLKHMGLLKDRSYDSTEKRENEVYQYLSCNGCVRRKKLLEQFAFTGKQLDHVLLKLECSGKVRHEGRGTWRAVLEEENFT